jgi:hypothetical protein
MIIEMIKAHPTKYRKPGRAPPESLLSREPYDRGWWPASQHYPEFGWWLPSPHPAAGRYWRNTE